MTDAELFRLAELLVEKHHRIESDVDTAVRTTVVDAYLVFKGRLSVEDFA